MSHSKFEFQGSEVVRLINDHIEYGLQAGDCGLVWGIYDLKPVVYEATFFDHTGESVDMMFNPSDVEKTSIENASFPEHIIELRELLESDSKS